MKRVTKSLLIINVILMMMFTGCSEKIVGENEGSAGNTKPPAAGQGAVSSGEKKSEKYLHRINQLKEEINKYDKSLTPGEKAKINNAMSSLLHDILVEKDSIKLTEEEILTNSEEFYLNFSKEYEVSNGKYRIIELGSKDNDMGTSIDLYIQRFRDDEVISVEKVYNAVQGANITLLKNYNLVSEKDRSYFIIVDELYGPDSPLLRLYVYENDGSKWLLSNNIEGINNEYWKSEKGTDSIIIKSDKINGNTVDFDVTSDNNELQIKIKDKGNNSIIDCRKIVLVQGKIKIQ